MSLAIFIIVKLIIIISILCDTALTTIIICDYYMRIRTSVLYTAIFYAAL